METTIHSLQLTADQLSRRVKALGNTISANLVVQQLVQTAIEIMPSLLAPLKSFATVLPNSRQAAMTDHQIPNITACPATLVDPDDWETDRDSVIAALQAAPHAYSQSFHMSHADVNSGLDVRALATSNLNEFAKTVLAAALSLFSTANYSSGVAITAGNFGTADLSPLMDAVRSSRRCALLDSSIYCKTLPPALGSGPWGLPGFAAVHEIGYGLPAGTLGVVADPTAMVITAGVPLMPGGVIESRKFTIEGLGIECLASVWGDSQHRFGWVSYDLVMSCAVAKAANAKLITAAQ